jgi:hypothetical protein
MFRVEQEYQLERRRLLNRTVHGWGVVSGYSVSAASQVDDDARGQLQIGAGLALDQCGKELVQTRSRTIAVKDVLLFDDDGKRIEQPPEGSYRPRGQDDANPTCWLLSVHYAERAAGPTTVNDPCSCKHTEWDRICETVHFSLRPTKCEKCCKVEQCALDCECGKGSCCDQHAEAPAARENRGGCQCLCHHVMNLPEVTCGALRKIEDACNHIEVDFCHSVPLACVGLAQGRKQGEWLFDKWIEACGPRRLVKRNDLLFDLIRGCDLTRISWVKWSRWHRQQATWNDFSESFGSLPADAVDKMRRSRDKRELFPVTTSEYQIEFSRPVRKDTVRTDCFSMLVLGREKGEAWCTVFRVPIVGVATEGASADASLITKATLIVDGRWLYDAVLGESTIFDDAENTVEIEIRGDLIIDCNGQPVDANALGLAPYPTGNGAPGGTFFSSFRVESKFKPDEPAQGARR